MNNHVMLSTQRSTTQLWPGRSARGGFTLLELLVVIVIITILMTLSLRVYSGVSRNVQSARVKIEIDGMAGALEDFKTKFGFYPPSRIRLVENPSSNPWPAASRAVLRQMFPQFNFNLRQNINGDGDTTDVIDLRGAECLIFFLGGVPDSEDKNGNGQLDPGEDRNGNGALDWIGDPVGFSKNPAVPFLRVGSNRIGPFFEFDSGRIQKPDLDNDFMPEYVSPLSSQTKPYLYLSAYNGRGYKIADLGGLMGSFYRQGNNLTGPAWKPKSFQIICPGFDDRFGYGGKFEANAADSDLINNDFNPNDGDLNDPFERRDPERDNITNFHTGMLAP